MLTPDLGHGITIRTMSFDLTINISTIVAVIMFVFFVYDRVAKIKNFVLP